MFALLSSSLYVEVWDRHWLLTRRTSGMRKSAAFYKCLYARVRNKRGWGLVLLFFSLLHWWVNL